jgi:hypothetical protein
VPTFLAAGTLAGMAHPRDLDMTRSEAQPTRDEALREIARLMSRGARTLLAERAAEAQAAAKDKAAARLLNEVV